MTDETWTLRLTKNGTTLVTDDSVAKISRAQRDALHAWLVGVGSSPAQPDWHELRERILRAFTVCPTYGEFTLQLSAILAEAAAQPRQPETQTEIERLQLELAKANGRYDECCKFRNKLIARLGARAHGLEVPE